MRMRHVYCGCSTSTSMFDDSECGWNGYVVGSDDPEDATADTWNCPDCGAEGLLVAEHEVMPDHDRPAFL